MSSNNFSGLLEAVRNLKQSPSTKIHKDEVVDWKELKVGDRSERGTVVEIGEGYIKTKGTWGNGEEVKTWTDTDKVKHSINYESYQDLH